MAKSGTIWGSFSGKSTSIARPYIVWEAANPNITNNTTLVTAKLYFVRYDGYRSYDNNGQNFTVTLDGTATTQNQPYDIGPNGASDLIMTVSKTVTHNSDGTKTITISASGNTNNSSLGTVSVSGSVTLDTIPRASSFTAFTLSNTVLNTSTATTINYTLDKKSTSFTDYLTLKYGSKTIASWSTTGEGALTRTLTAAEVNSIIVAMPNSTSGTLTLTNQTKNGSTNVGSTTSINEGISLNAAIKPTATGLTASIYGTGRDKTISKYVQSISKVTASFTGTAGYGATESANTIVVRRQSDDANSQTITGESGTTANAVTLSGVYEIIATAKDSRGRSTTQTITITVEAYTAPKITTFTAKRNATTSTTVDATINVSWSALGTSNPTDVVVVGKNNAGVSTTHYNLVDSTAGAINTTQSYTGQSDASSYTYTITLTDSFGKTASATVAVGTSFIEMTIAKGLGVGIGKVHENGALDVKGDIWSNGVNLTKGSAIPPGNDTTVAYWHALGSGTYMARPGDLTAQPTNYGIVDVMKGGSDSEFTAMWYSQPNGDIYRKSGNANQITGWVSTANNRLQRLWSGASYMTSGQTITPTKALSDCPNGWMLTWSYYNGSSTSSSEWNFTFIPKNHVDGTFLHQVIATTGWVITTKYLKVWNTNFSGHDGNSQSPRNNAVLRYVDEW